MFNLRSYSFAVQRRGPLLLWEQGMRVSRSSFVTRSEERALRVMRREYYLHRPAALPQIPRTTAHIIEPIVKSPSQPSLTQMAAHWRTSLLPLRNVNPQPMNGNPPLAPPPPRATKGTPPPQGISYPHGHSWTERGQPKSRRRPPSSKTSHHVF